MEQTAAKREPDWYALGVGNVMDELGTTREGLSDEEAAERLQRLGPNRLVVQVRKPLWRELLKEVTEPLPLLLIAIGVLYLVFGSARDGIAIFVIIACMGLIEGVADYRSRRSLDALKALSAPQARVLRGGTVREVPVEEVVPADVVELVAGDVVPADCRVLEAEDLAVDESALTGEPGAAAKGVDPVAVGAPLAERSSMLFASTVVVRGQGQGVVVATASDTEIGHLGKLTVEAESPPTPLQRAMSEIARYALVVAIAASVLVPLIGYLLGRPLLDMVQSGLALAFSTVPEELPMLVVLLLVIAAQRLARRGALIRNLSATETLGGVTEIATDKTGTLTENRLHLARTVGDRDAVLRVALASQAAAVGAGGEVGDPLEVELAAEAAHDGVTWTGTDGRVFPFDPVRKRTSRVWREDGGGAYVAVKGSPDAILARCADSDPRRVQAQDETAGLARDGLRVIAFADRHTPTAPADSDEAERDLHFVGLAGFSDPLRPGVPEAVAALREASVGTIIVTGDDPLTGVATARAAGLDDTQPLTGGDALAAVPDAELEHRLQPGTVIGRATPADKLRIVRDLQARKEVVAVTGDGINDAPALAAADVGIAMGKRGTDLAREAADVVLTDDAFPTIEVAVESGRNVASQLRRGVAFYLSVKVAIILVMLIPLAMGLSAPLRPAHIIILEMFMDLGASVAFVFEPVARDAMRRPPRNPARRFLDRDELSATAANAIALAGGVLLAFFLARHNGSQYGVPAAIATWLLAHVGVAWSLRAQPGLPIRQNPFFAIWILLAAVAAVLLTTTGIAHALGTPKLPAHDWWFVVGSALLATVLAALATRITGIVHRL